MNMYQRLKDIREDKDLDQSDIAKVLKSTQQQISKYEKGIQKMGADKYLKLAEYYNISLDYIMGLIDTPRALIEKTVPTVQALTEKQKKLLKAYSENPQLQEAIDKLLNI